MTRTEYQDMSAGYQAPSHELYPGEQDVVYCRGPLSVAPCRTNGVCWGHEGCVGFADCPCIRCRNDRYNTREAARR